MTGYRMNRRALLGAAGLAVTAVGTGTFLNNASAGQSDATPTAEADVSAMVDPGTSAGVRPAAGGSGQTLIFSDEFNGKTLNTVGVIPCSVSSWRRNRSKCRAAAARLPSSTSTWTTTRCALAQRVQPTAWPAPAAATPPAEPAEATPPGRRGVGPARRRSRAALAGPRCAAPPSAAHCPRRTAGWWRRGR